MRKRFISLLACGALAATSLAGFAACGGGGADLTVWGPSSMQESLKEMIEEFKEENPDIKLSIDVGVCGEGDAFSQMSTDPQSGADVYAWANDQVANLNAIGALSALTSSDVTALQKRMPQSTIDFGKLGNKYYGYPYSADNGFFLFYNSSIVSADQAKTVEGIIKACQAKSVKFIVEITNSWYVNSFTFGAGGRYDLTRNESGAITKVNVNFDQKPEGSDYSYGQLGAQMVADLLHGTNADTVVVGDDKVIDQYLSADGVGAIVRGTWKADDIKNAWDDDYEATILPKWTSSLDKKQYEWYSFAGGKLWGVNSYSKHIDEAHKLAAFLASDKMQEKRFDDNSILPASTAVAALQKVKDNKAASAFLEQMSHSVVQIAMPDNYWSEGDSMGTYLKTFTGTPEELATRIGQYVTALKSAASATK